MATPIPEFTSHPGNEKYPWDEWCDGRVWQVVRGEDFPGLARAFTSQLYLKAARMGLKCRVHTLPDQKTVQFQFTPKTNG